MSRTTSVGVLAREYVGISRRNTGVDWRYLELAVVECEPRFSACIAVTPVISSKSFPNCVFEAAVFSAGAPAPETLKTIEFDVETGDVRSNPGFVAIIREGRSRHPDSTIATSLPYPPE